MYTIIILLLFLAPASVDPCNPHNSYSYLTQTDHGYDEFATRADLAAESLERLTGESSRHIHYSSVAETTEELSELHTTHDFYENGIDRNPFLFFLTHGGTERWGTLKGGEVALNNVLVGDCNLRYLMFFGCQIMAHGPKNKTTFRYNHPEDFKPAQSLHANVFSRWREHAHKNLRMVCGGSTSLSDGDSSSDVGRKAWGKIDSGTRTIAEAFVEGLSDSKMEIPLCLSWGGATWEESPLTKDKAIKIEANNFNGGTIHLLYIDYFDNLPGAKSTASILFSSFPEGSKDSAGTLPLLHLQRWDYASKPLNLCSNTDSIQFNAIHSTRVESPTIYFSPKTSDSPQTTVPPKCFKDTDEAKEALLTAFASCFSGGTSESALRTVSALSQQLQYFTEDLSVEDGFAFGVQTLNSVNEFFSCSRKPVIRFRVAQRTGLDGRPIGAKLTSESVKHRVSQHGIPILDEAGRVALDLDATSIGSLALPRWHRPIAMGSCPLRPLLSAQKTIETKELLEVHVWDHGEFGYRLWEGGPPENPDSRIFAPVYRFFFRAKNPDRASGRYFDVLAVNPGTDCQISSEPQLDR